MKKKLLIFLAVIATLACLLAISVSADSINPSSSNEFGTLTTFDDEIGNTGISNLKDDGTIARAVIYDGTSYYTVPTVYLLTESPKTVSGEVREMFLLSFSDISGKLGKTIDKNSIIRIEFPDEIYYIGNGNENLNNCKNVIEVVVNDGLRFWGNDQSKAFTHCESLVSIDLSKMIIEYPNNAFALFEYCYKLESVVLPDAYHNGTSYVNYDTNHMFSGCYPLTSVENAYNFFRGTTALGYKTFYNCYALPEPILWEGLTFIEGRAFGNCRAIETVVIPSTVTTIGSNSSGAFKDTETVFEACTSLKKVVFPSGAVAVGRYCFEKCTAITDVWMPGAGSTFEQQVFGQIGSSKAVKFYFTTQTSTITINDSYNQNDPFITAVNNSDTSRLLYNTPLSTKCTVFFDGHEPPASVNSCTSGGSCVVCATVLEGIATSHDLLTSIVYANGFDNAGVKSITCQNWDRCTVENSSTAAPAIFSAKGYSYRQDKSSGLCGGFAINQDALTDYKTVYQNAEIKISVLIVNPKYLTTDGSVDFFDENGITTATGGAIQIDISDAEYQNYEYMIGGFTVEHMENLKLAFALIVSENGKVSVVQKQYSAGEESSVKESYVDKSGVSLYCVTVESIDPDVVASLKKEEE